MSMDTNAHHYQTHPSIVWVDCEMTGLDINVDKLMEVAVIITSSDLVEEASLGPLVVRTEKPVLDAMGDWCTKQHTKSGLVKSCLESKLTVEEVDKQLCDLLSSRGIKNAAIAGNSVSYDRVFLAKFCPKFSKLLHYRTIDVSSFKEVLR